MIRSNFRASRLGGRESCRKSFLWNFVKFPGKQLCSCYARVSFLIKIAELDLQHY